MAQPADATWARLPAAGQWVQLKVPASQVNLEGSTINGMGFALYDGAASWDAAGRVTTTTGTTVSTVSLNTTNSVVSRLTGSPAVITFNRAGDTQSRVNRELLRDRIRGQWAGLPTLAFHRRDLNFEHPGGGGLRESDGGAACVK